MEPEAPLFGKIPARFRNSLPAGPLPWLNQVLIPRRLRPKLSHLRLESPPRPDRGQRSKDWPVYHGKSGQKYQYRSRFWPHDPQFPPHLLPRLRARTRLGSERKEREALQPAAQFAGDL